MTAGTIQWYDLYRSFANCTRRPSTSGQRRKQRGASTSGACQAGAARLSDSCPCVRGSWLLRCARARSRSTPTIQVSRQRRPPDKPGLDCEAPDRDAPGYAKATSGVGRRGQPLSEVPRRAAAARGHPYRVPSGTGRPKTRNPEVTARPPEVPREGSLGGQPRRATPESPGPRRVPWWRFRPCHGPRPCWLRYRPSGPVD